MLAGNVRAVKQEEKLCNDAETSMEFTFLDDRLSVCGG